MKFKNYLNESMNANDIYDIILRDCKPFIKEWQKLRTQSFLLSGRRSSINDIKKHHTRIDRKPVDLPIDIHNLVDRWFYKKFGIKARSKSIFATFGYGMANFYGTPQLVFPIGNFRVIYSDDISDLYSIYARTRKKHILNNEYSESSHEMKTIIKKEIIEELNNSHYTDKLSFTNSEIMLVCKEYYLVDYKHSYNLPDYIINKKGY